MKASPRPMPSPRLLPALLPALLVALLLVGPGAAPVAAADGDLFAAVDDAVAAVEDDVIAWRRDIHQHPELGNRETRTAAKVAEHLTSLGLEVRTGVAHTGVVGVLRGGRPGPVIAIRADMDALPVVEQVDVPFASKVRTEYLGEEVGVMHACGHDVHVSVLMGVADVLAGMKQELPGTVVFLFQPAEEGAPAGEDGGAEMMVAEGAMADPKPEAVFALHAASQWEVGEVAFCSGGAMASSDVLRIKVQGRQTHAAMPWRGIDPVVVASQIVLGLQTVTSRQIAATTAPAIVSVATIHGGVRSNIIPDEVEMTGTIRSLDPEMREEIHRRVKQTAESIAAAAGTTAEVEIERGYPVTVNDPALGRRMFPVLARAVGGDNALYTNPVTTAEDFAYFQQEAPGFYFYLGVASPGTAETAAPNHSPLFFSDEGSLAVGVKALSYLAVDYLSRGADGSGAAMGAAETSGTAGGR